MANSQGIRSSREARSATALLFCTSFVVLVGFSSGCGGPASTYLTVGERAPDFSAPEVGGDLMTLTDLEGEPHLLVFWATWCQPCLAEIPALEKIEAEHPGRIVSIALDEGGGTDVSRFLAKRPLPYRVVLGDAALFARYDGLAIPHTVVLDPELKVVAVHRGLVDEELLLAELSKL